jgi:hypothetical protein
MTDPGLPENSYTVNALNQQRACRAAAALEMFIKGAASEVSIDAVCSEWDDVDTDACDLIANL